MGLDIPQATREAILSFLDSPEERYKPKWEEIQEEIHDFWRMAGDNPAVRKWGWAKYWLDQRGDHFLITNLNTSEVAVLMMYYGEGFTRMDMTMIRALPGGIVDDGPRTEVFRTRE